MTENGEFIVDKNGILLDRKPGSLHLDENGIVQDSDYSALQLPGDYDDTQLRLYNSQDYQSFHRSRDQLDEQSWYYNSDLEISDDEKGTGGVFENFTLKSASHRKQSPDQASSLRAIHSNQNLDSDFNQVFRIDCGETYPPLNHGTFHQRSSCSYDDKDPLGVFMDQRNTSFMWNYTNNGIMDYQVPTLTGSADTTDLYQKTEFTGISECSSKSSLSVPEGLTTSERELYLQHVNDSQTLESSHNESYHLRETLQGNQYDHDDDDDDDELFLITGHIDFDADRQPSRPASANIWEHSLGIGQKIAKCTKENGPKNRIGKRSVSFDLLPQKPAIDQNKEIPSVDQNPIKMSPSDDFQENNSFIKQKISQNHHRETSQYHPDFDQHNSKRHSNQFQNIKKGRNNSANTEVSLNSDSNSNLVGENRQVRTEEFDSFYHYLSDESFQSLGDRKILVSPENHSRQSSLKTKISSRETEKPGNAKETKTRCIPDETSDELPTKSQTESGIKSIRAKSKSTTSICSASTPVKSKCKSMSELSNTTMDKDDGDDGGDLKMSSSIKELNARLEEELSRRKNATKIVEQLQNQYDNLLTRYADAEMMIDELRIGSKMAPKIADFKLSQSPISNLMMNRALVTSTPLASTFSMNQSLQKDDVLLADGNLISNKTERHTKANKQPKQQPSSRERIEADLILQANNLESKITTLVSLLEKGQLTTKEVKKVFDNIRSEQDKQRREYLRVKDEFLKIGTNSEEEFDKDRELEGYLFQLQMRFDELEDKYKHLQETQKEPFQETENQGKDTSSFPQTVSDSKAEEKRRKFLLQYNSLMDRYHRLKNAGSLNEKDEEVKEIQKKLQVISQELCLTQQTNQEQAQRTYFAESKMTTDSPKLKNQMTAVFPGQNVGHLEEMNKMSTSITPHVHQQTTSSQMKPFDKRINRIVRSLPSLPRDSCESSKKKSGEVSSPTSVPDSGIFDELNGAPHHHRPSVTNRMKLTSSRSHRVSSVERVNMESSDGLTIDNSPRVPGLSHKRRNSLGLVEVSSQSTEAASLNSQLPGDDSLLWQPAVHRSSHNRSSSTQGRNIESEPVEYSSENSDRTDLDTSGQSTLMRKAKPKSILRRKHKASKIRQTSGDNTDQKFEPKSLQTNSFTEQKERSKSNNSSIDRSDENQQRQRSMSLDFQKTKSMGEKSFGSKSSNKEKLKNLQLEIESLKARFNNGIPWKNVRIPSDVKSKEHFGGIPSSGIGLPSSSNPILFSSSPDVYHNDTSQEPQYQTTVRSSLEEFHRNDPPLLAGPYREINSNISGSHSQSTANSNAALNSLENISVTVLDYHSPASHKTSFQRIPPQKSSVLSEPEHRSNSSLYLPNQNNRMEFLAPARSVQDIPQMPIDHNIPRNHFDHRQYHVLDQSADYYKSTPEFVSGPHQSHFQDDTGLNGQRILHPSHTHSPYRIPSSYLHSNTTQRQNYSSIPKIVKRNSELHSSKSHRPVHHSVTQICDICGVAGCTHNYITEFNYPHHTQGNLPIPAPPYSVYNQNLPPQQQNHFSYRNYQSPDGDLDESISLAERTIEDINHLTKKMMRTMHEELIKSKRNYDFFYPF